MDKLMHKVAKLVHSPRSAEVEETKSNSKSKLFRRSVESGTGQEKAKSKEQLFEPKGLKMEERNLEDAPKASKEVVLRNLQEDVKAKEKVYKEAIDNYQSKKDAVFHALVTDDIELMDKHGIKHRRVEYYDTEGTSNKVEIAQRESIKAEEELGNAKNALDKANDNLKKFS